MKQRNGSTLIELVLSMSAGSSVMLLAISLVHQTMIVTERSRNRSDNSRTLDQLSQNFRRDVHLATELNFDGEGKLTLISADGSQITYVIQNHSVVRQRKHTAEENEQERYQLAEDASALFQGIQEPDRATLTVRGETGLPGISPRVDLHVEATLGRWQARSEERRVGKECA